MSHIWTDASNGPNIAIAAVCAAGSKDYILVNEVSGIMFKGLGSERVESPDKIRCSSAYYTDSTR